MQGVTSRTSQAFAKKEQNWIIVYAQCVVVLNIFECHKPPATSPTSISLVVH